MRVHSTYAQVLVDFCTSTDTIPNRGVRSSGGDFDFDSFTRILNRPGGFRDPGEPEEYCRGFQVFDKDLTGFIGVGQFRYILTNLGEKMSEEEVDELLKTVDTSSGELNYMGTCMHVGRARLGRLRCAKMVTGADIRYRYGQDYFGELSMECDGPLVRRWE